ncbi:hypothetical protein RFI_13267 [Reticulomyxa filosa]|uniref:Uncharacterized protein n=1 Tax=Reticulomyxa filosa TaxID=46433 RepID=X6NDE7_RETFI|nr:hypothetical protein RFI_13267 [Reticulomyxa filosa]|eukprot:ETO23893.1 hypothetical protein RFI_13267 [Reticulomyxa filosa]
MELVHAILSQNELTTNNREWIERQLAQVVQGLLEQEKEKDKELGLLQRQVETLTEELRDSTILTNELKQQLQYLQSAKQEMQALVERYDHDNVELQNKCQSYEQMLHRMDESLAEHKQMVEQLQQEAHDLRELIHQPIKNNNSLAHDEHDHAHPHEHQHTHEHGQEHGEHRSEGENGQQSQFTHVNFKGRKIDTLDEEEEEEEERGRNGETIKNDDVLTQVTDTLQYDRHRDDANSSLVDDEHLTMKHEIAQLKQKCQQLEIDLQHATDLIFQLKDKQSRLERENLELEQNNTELELLRESEQHMYHSKKMELTGADTLVSLTNAEHIESLDDVKYGHEDVNDALVPALLSKHDKEKDKNKDEDKDKDNRQQHWSVDREVKERADVNEEHAVHNENTITSGELERNKTNMSSLKKQHVGTDSEEEFFMLTYIACKTKLCEAFPKQIDLDEMSDIKQTDLWNECQKRGIPMYHFHDWIYQQLLSASQLCPQDNTPTHAPTSISVSEPTHKIHNTNPKKNKPLKKWLSKDIFAALKG